MIPDPLAAHTSSLAAPGDRGRVRTRHRGQIEHFVRRRSPSVGIGRRQVHDRHHQRADGKADDRGSQRVDQRRGARLGRGHIVLVGSDELGWHGPYAFVRRRAGVRRGRADCQDGRCRIAPVGAQFRTARRVGLLLVRGMPKLLALLFTVGVVAMLLSAGCSNLTPGTDWPVALISRALSCRLVSRRRWTGSLQATSAARPGLLQPGLLATPRGWAPTSRQAANSELKSPCRPVRPESFGFGRSGLVSGEAEGLC